MLNNIIIEASNRYHSYLAYYENDDKFNINISLQEKIKVINQDQSNHEYFEKYLEDKMVVGKRCFRYYPSFCIYEVTKDEFNHLYELAKKNIDEGNFIKKLEEEKLEKLKSSFNIRLISEIERYEEDICVEVELESTYTKEKTSFLLKNIFDYGFLIVKEIDNKKCCMSSNHWESYQKIPDAKEYDKEFVKVRKLTEFESLCKEYLYRFSPIPTWIRL